MSETLARVLGRTGFVRRSPLRYGGRGDHKEWLHFAIAAPGVDALVNFSVFDETAQRSERGHLVLLARDTRWRGDVVRFTEREMEIGGGDLRVRLGGNAITFSDGRIRIHAAIEHPRITLDAELTPETFPSLANNVCLAGSDSLCWLIVPRLSVEGQLCIEGTTYDLGGASGYHDHNWGHFRWGSDFSWEWGYAASARAAAPWAFVFTRLRNRANTRDETRVLTVWRDGIQVKSFRDEELAFERRGFLRATPYKVPGVMRLLAPQHATGVPERVRIVASGHHDELTIAVTPIDVAQIIVPNDDMSGVTIINEVSTQVDVTGVIQDERVAWTGRGMSELLTA